MNDDINNKILELIETDARLRALGFLVVTIGMGLAWACGLLPVPNETGAPTTPPAAAAAEK